MSQARRSKEHDDLDREVAEIVRGALEKHPEPWRPREDIKDAPSSAGGAADEAMKAVRQRLKAK